MDVKAIIEAIKKTENSLKKSIATTETKLLWKIEEISGFWWMEEC